MEAGGERRFLGTIVSHFGTTPLKAIDNAAIHHAARSLHPHSSAATINRQVFTPTTAVLRHAAKLGLCSVPIVSRPRVRNERVRWLTPTEAEALIAACADHLRPLVIFMLYTGARCGEALWLDWRQVDLTRRHVSFVMTKNGEARGVPLHPRVIVTLASLNHREGEVFRKHDGCAYTRPRTRDDTSAGTRIETAFAGAVRRAGLTDFHPHDCRHTWATWHYAANRDLGALKKLGGWKSEKMVLRYAHVNTDEFAASINRLPGGSSGELSTAGEIIV
jgi:integrase